MSCFKKIGAVLLVVVMLLSVASITICAHAESEVISEEFSDVLIDGKLVLNFAKPASANDEIVWIAADGFCLANPNFMFDPDTFTADFSKVELSMYAAEKETHIVDVVWNYDADVLKASKDLVHKFPEAWGSYIQLQLTDLELVNYWAYQKQGNTKAALANFSSELKSALGQTNFYFEVQVYGGGYEPFYTANGGVARLMHNGSGYQSLGGISARANHVIYIPESIANTKEAIMAAAQKRIDDYIGKGVVNISYSGEKVTEYYNKQIADYDARVAAVQIQLADVRAQLVAEQAKEELLRDQNVIDQCMTKISDYEWDLEVLSVEKENFISYFEDGGLYDFMKDAAGEFIFDAEVVNRNETYKLVVVKDDNKLAIPSYNCTDIKTDVSVSTDSSEVPLDTVIKVEKITHGEEHERICGVLEIKNGEMFDIKLHSGALDDYISQLKNGKFKVRLPIPKEYAKKELVVYYVDSNGNKTKYNVTVKNNFAFFETDHFSIYTLATVSENNVMVPNTGDNSSIIPWFIMLFISGIGLITAIYIGKRKTSK